MKKSNLALLILLLATVFLLNACASSIVGPTQGFSKTIEEAHPDRWEKTIIGMDINEFKNVWPEAHRSGMSEDGETYEFIYYHISQPILVYGQFVSDYKIYTYFYFTNNKLAKYESQQKSGF
jgi:hypothetical protein